MDENKDLTVPVVQVVPAVPVANDTKKEDINKIVEEINEISDEIKNSTDAKPWWTSKTVLVNFGALVVMTTAYFGIDLKSHGIDVKGIVEMAAFILPIVNIWFRTNSSKPSQPIKRVFMPDSMKVAMANSVSAVKAKFTRGS